MTSNTSYLTGEAIEVGDRILVDKRKSGVVEYLIEAGSEPALLHGCPKTGGIMLKFDNGDLQMWVRADEDLEFVSRKS